MLNDPCRNETLGWQAVGGPGGMGGGFFGDAAATTCANDCHGQITGKTKLAGTVNDLGRSMTIDECLGDNDTWTQISNLGLGQSSHKNGIPFY